MNANKLIEKAIDAGLKEVDLYEAALEDMITRQHLNDFMRAALAAVMPDRVAPGEGGK